MILRRYEVKRVMAGEREVFDPEETINLLHYIQRYSLPCIITVSGHGIIRDCSIVAIDSANKKVRLFTRVPNKVSMDVKIEDIYMLEADSNVDFLEKKSDEEERMSRIR